MPDADPPINGHDESNASTPKEPLGEVSVDAALDRIRAADDPVADAFLVLDELEADGQWAAIRAVADSTLAEPGRDLQADERAELVFRVGVAVEFDGDEDAAFEHYGLALDADPGHQASLLSLANIQYRRGELEHAEKTYRTLLARHRDDLEPTSRAEAYYRLGRIRLDEVGDADRARSVVEKALSAQPSHLAARRLLIDIHRAGSNWEKVVSHEHRLLDFEEDADERFRALLNLGDMVRERLEDDDLAEHYYSDALQLAPSDPQPVKRLYDLHLAAGRHQAAVRDLARLGGLAGQGREARASWYAEMARLYVDHLDDPETAVACYNQALELDPSLLDSFEACNELLVATGDWTVVEQHHRRMLGRLGSDGAGNTTEIRSGLWLNLVEIYRHHLDDPDNALFSVEAVTELSPRDLEAHELAATLFAERTDLEPQRVRRFHRRFLRLEPRRVSSIRALRRLELRAERADAAWWLCARLAAEGDIDRSEEAYLENLRRANLPEVEQPLSADLWGRHIRHPDVDAGIERLLALTNPVLIGLYGQELRKVGAKRKLRIEPDASLLFMRVLGDVARALGLPAPPETYRLKNRAGVDIAGTAPPVLLVGPDMLSGKRHQELGFALARCLGLLSPGFLPTVYVPEETLPWLLRALVAIHSPAVEITRDAAFDSLRRGLDQDLSSEVRAEVEEVSLQLAQETEEGAFDTARYLRGVALTCDRVGLLLGEDLGAAADQATDRDDLLGYAISEDHLALRQALGIAYQYDKA